MYKTVNIDQVTKIKTHMIFDIEFFKFIITFNIYNIININSF